MYLTHEHPLIACYRFLPLNAAKHSLHYIIYDVIIFFSLQTNHRRSRSVDERWVDHHSKNEVPTGTVFQPTIAAGGKKRKSVTQLDAKIVNQSTNYVLTHQQADDDGNLETHLFKGNIIPTAGGGSAVVFNDVESLLQGSPINNDGPARWEGLAFDLDK